MHAHNCRCVCTPPVFEKHTRSLYTISPSNSLARLSACSRLEGDSLPFAFFFSRYRDVPRRSHESMRARHGQGQRHRSSIHERAEFQDHRADCYGRIAVMAAHTDDKYRKPKGHGQILKMPRELPRTSQELSPLSVCPQKLDVECSTLEKSRRNYEDVRRLKGSERRHAKALKTKRKRDELFLLSTSGLDLLSWFSLKILKISWEGPNEPNPRHSSDAL